METIKVRKNIQTCVGRYIGILKYYILPEYYSNFGLFLSVQYNSIPITRIQLLMDNFKFEYCKCT